MTNGLRSPASPWQHFDLVQRASACAAEAHRQDLRKGTAIPYLSHLWSVAALVLEHGGDDEQVAAGSTTWWRTTGVCLAWPTCRSASVPRWPGGCAIDDDQPSHECPSGHRWLEPPS